MKKMLSQAKSNWVWANHPKVAKKWMKDAPKINKAMVSKKIKNKYSDALGAK